MDISTVKVFASVVNILNNAIVSLERRNEELENEVFELKHELEKAYSTDR